MALAPLKGCSMALTALRWTLNVTLRDSGYNTTNKEYQLRATDHTTAVAAATAILAKLDAVSDAKPQSYRITQSYGDVNFSGGGGEVEELAIISGISSSARGISTEIPAPKDAVFKNTVGTDRNIVNVALTAVQEYLALFASGGSAYISDNESWVTTVDGQRGTKKSRQRKA